MYGFTYKYVLAKYHSSYPANKYFDSNSYIIVVLEVMWVLRYLSKTLLTLSRYLRQLFLLERNFKDFNFV